MDPMQMSLVIFIKV